MTLTPKLFLAAVCGFTTALLVAYGPSTEFGAGWFLRYFMCGTLFAITVLWPYLRNEPYCLCRGLALIATGIIGLWTALKLASVVQAALPAAFIGSLAALAIVTLAACLLIPFAGMTAFVVPVILGAAFGGYALSLASGSDSVTVMILSFSVWHLAAALALHSGVARLSRNQRPWISSRFFRNTSTIKSRNVRKRAASRRSGCESNQTS